METPEKIGGLTQAEISALKKQHNTKTLFKISVNSEEGDRLHFWLKKPDMTVLSAFASMAANDPFAASQMLFKDCLVKGKESYANDTYVFPAIMEQLPKTMETAKATLEKF